MVNKNVVQPYIVPALAAINEHVIQPYVQPLVDNAVNQVNKVTTWVDEKIYQPVFAPVVNDINKYIYQPLAQKTSEVWDKYGEWVHNALDVVGFVPGLGDIADGVNGLIYLAEGRYIEAAVSVASMVPIVGDLGKVGKWGAKVGAGVVGGIMGAAAAKAIKEFVEKLFGKVAKNVGEEAVEKAAKEVVEEGAGKTLKEAAEKLIKDSSEQMAKDAFEKGAKIAADYPEGLVKYKEFYETMTEISQKAKTAIPGDDPLQLLDDLEPLYREITDAPLELQQEFARLKQLHLSKTETPLTWDEFMKLKQSFSKAEEATPQLQDLIKKLAEQTNGTPQLRDRLKDMERAVEKMVVEEGNHASHLTDLTAGRIVYEDLESLYRALDDIHANNKVIQDANSQLVFFKDRFMKPQSSGYKDIITNIQLPNGHVGEIRLEVAPMNKAAEMEHKLYELRRSLEGLDQPTLEEEAIVEELKEQAKLIYGDAWNEVIANFVAK